MARNLNKSFLSYLLEKAKWLRKETLRIHKVAPETRIASCLSAVEIFTVLYYGKIFVFNIHDSLNKKRDRLIISKGHGSVSLYPILFDFGLIKEQYLKTVCSTNAQFGSIPSSKIPIADVINGSLGHGIGIGCGVALALKRKKNDAQVFVVIGDGELYEGSNWEAIMFAGQHRLDNLNLIIDNNKISMLDYCKNIINLEPLQKKFKMFGWEAKIVDGHNVKALYGALCGLKKPRLHRPKVLIANTTKGKGVKELEGNSLCHIRSLTPEEVDRAIDIL